MQHSYAWFGDENRTSASVNCSLLILTFAWTIIYGSVVFLLLTGDGRKFSTFITTTLSVISGVTITLGIYDREWVHGHLQTESSYSRFMPTAVPGKLSVSLGLSNMNISYVSLDPSMDFFYNEQFKLDDEWHNHNILEEEYVNALRKGSPNPVLGILEFLSCGGFAFVYRKAGFVTLSGLWISLVMWAFCQALLLAVPKAASRAFFLTGSMTLLSAVSYFFYIPSASLQMYVEGVRLDLRIGRTFYLVVMGGFINIVLSIVFGFGVRCKTSFEAYYQTDFDFYRKGRSDSLEMEDINENGRWTEGWNDDYKNYRVNRVCDTSLYPRPVTNDLENAYDAKYNYQIGRVNEGFVDDSENTYNIKDDSQIAYVNKGFVDDSENTYNIKGDSQIAYVNEGFVDNSENTYNIKDDSQIAYVNEGFVDDSENTYNIKDDSQIAYGNVSFVNESASGENLLNSHNNRLTKINIETPVRNFIRSSKFFRKSMRKRSHVLFDNNDTERGVDDRHIDVLSNLERVQSVIKDTDSVKDKPKHVDDDIVWYDTVDELF